jgi:5-methylcytosine-specific restriction enzyme subunit McrC
MVKIPQSDIKLGPIVLKEWDRVGPATCPQLKGTSLKDDVAAQRLADSLRSRVDIREGYGGLEIATTSFVGHIDVGPLRIAIQPKLPAMPLTILLRYAYGLRDVGILDETRTPTTRHGLHDLLIALLAAEVEELLHRGLVRRYISVSERLGSPRGRILIEEIVRHGGVKEASLPCLHFDRRTDWQLNQVLRAGLGVAGRMTEDRELRWRIHQLAAMFGNVEHKDRLDERDLDQVERGLTRLTATSAPALTIIRLLLGMQGASFEPIADPHRTPGFLFDMNYFFQRLLSRFLHENLTGHTIKDEYAAGNIFAYASDANPKRRSLPKPRPDFAPFRAKKLTGFLDAKYRDIWEKGFPAGWLYQLSIYALASPNQASILLYGTMSAEARDERIDIRQPVLWSSKGAAFVILRPVPLQRLAELLDPSRSDRSAAERKRFADELVIFDRQSFNRARVNQSGSILTQSA